MNSTASEDANELLAVLPAIDRSGDRQWLAALEDRKQEESRFHDEKVDRNGHEAGSDQLPELKRANKKFYATTGKSNDYLARWVNRHAPGKVVLDFACGQGGLTRDAARAGAELAIGLDISATSIANARIDAGREGLASTAKFIQGDCEATGLPDESVDIVLCSGMLHHLDVEQAFPEIHRILRPGGVCFSDEALAYNPAIKLYRMLTPKLRTDWEKRHILSHKELRIAERFFDVRDVRYWHLFSIFATPLRNTPLFRPVLASCNAIDAVALRVPLLRRMAWQFTFELHKAPVALDKNTNGRTAA